MAQPFFAITPGGALATGDPTKLLTRIAWQTDKTRPPVSGFYDFISEGGAAAPSPLVVNPLGIRGSSMGQVNLPGKMDFPTGPLGLRDLDPMNLAQMMFVANALEYVLTTNPSGASYLHRFGTAIQSEGSSYAAPAQMCMIRDDDKGQPVRMEHVRVRRLTIEVRSRGNARMIVEYVVGRYDYHGTVTQTVGSGATVPTLRGVDKTASFTTDEASMKVKIKLISKVAGTSATIQSARGVEAYDAASQQTILVDTETRLLRTSGALLFGDHADATSIIFSAADLATWDNNDEFEANPRRARWSPSFVAAYPLPETHARLWYYNGSTWERLSAQGGYSLVIDWPGAVRDEDMGYAQALGTLRTGEKVVTLNLSRTFSDLTVEKQLMLRSHLPLALEIPSNTRITGVNTDLSWTFITPYCIGEGNPAYSIPQGASPAPPNTAHVLLAKEPPVGATALSWGGTDINSEVEARVATEVTDITP